MKNNKSISLDDIGNELPFGVPNDYFEQFALQIRREIEIKSIPSSRTLKPWFYRAAILVGIVVVSNIFYSHYQQLKIIKDNNNISQEDESYVLSQVDESTLMDCYVDPSVR